MMERLQYPLSHEWHAAVNQHQDEQRKAGRSWGDARFMYDAIRMAKDGIRSTWGDFQAEGIVARPQTELSTRSGHRIITKVKCRDFAHD